jgi:hypothetical protein
MALLPPDNDGSAEFNLRISVFLSSAHINATELLHAYSPILVLRIWSNSVRGLKLWVRL